MSLHDTAPAISVQALIPGLKDELKTAAHPCRESVATYISQQLSSVLPSLFTSENLSKGSSKINFSFIYPDIPREDLKKGRFKEGLADKDIFFALQDIAKNEEKKRDLVRLIDCFVGPISLLIAGPQSFRRENITEFVSSKSPQMVITKNGSDTLSCVKIEMAYSRLTPFWLKNSVAVSVILGALRNAFELYLFGQMNGEIAKQVLLEERETKFLNILNRLEGKEKLEKEEEKSLTELVIENFSTFDQSWECLARPLNVRTLKALPLIVRTCRELDSTWHIRRPVEQRLIPQIGLYQWIDKHAADRAHLFTFYPSNIEFAQEEMNLFSEISHGGRTKQAPPRVYIDRFYY